MTETSARLREIGDSGGGVVSSSGARIGRITQVFLDDATGEPTWVSVQTPRSGASTSFVPLAGATVVDGEIVVAYEAEVVTGSPRVAATESISAAEQSDLSRYYHSSGGGRVAEQRGRNASRTDPAPGKPAMSQAGADISPSTDDNAMTRSEERLRIGVQRRATERVRLRKVIVTEEVTQTVTVRREELRVEREPLAGAESGSGAGAGEESYEIVLYAERPVLRTEVVPVERVRVSKEIITEQVTVSEDLRSEQIDTTIDQTAGVDR